MKNFREILEAKQKKITASGIVKLFKDTSEWGDDIQKQVSVVKGKLQYIDSFFSGPDASIKVSIEEWTTGWYAKYFKDTYDVTFKVVDTFHQDTPEKKYWKFTTRGIVGIILKVQ